MDEAGIGTLKHQHPASLTNPLHHKEATMTITLFAQPYDLAACGFYFEDFETYQNKSRDLRITHGDIVEEFHC